MCKRIIFPIVLLLLVITSCKQEKVYYEESGSVFHTIYSIKYESSKPLSKEIEAEFEKFNLSLNPFNPNSIITKVNNNEQVELDEWFTEVFTKAQEVSTISEGAFDITCAPLVNLWGFGFANMDSVSQQAIDSLKEFTGYQKIRLEGGKIIKDDPRVILNTSAIAKGFSCDVIARLMEKEGIENYMIDIGGEVTLKGVNPKGNCWRIGINKPEDDKTGMINEVNEVVQLCKKGGIATSGNYRNFYVKDGKKFGHTIDPITGYPTEKSILSATVVANDCMTADAYATVFMVVGIERAAEIAKKVPEIEYYLIYADEDGSNQVVYSEGMLNYLPNRQKIAALENL